VAGVVNRLDAGRVPVTRPAQWALAGRVDLELIDALLGPLAVVAHLAVVVDPAVDRLEPALLDELPPALVALFPPALVDVPGLPPAFIHIPQFPPTFIDVARLPPALVDVDRLPPALVPVVPPAYVTPVAPEEGAAVGPAADVGPAPTAHVDRTPPPAADVEIAPTPATNVELTPAPAADVELAPPPAANVVVAPATLVDLDPLADLFVADDAPIAARLPLLVGAARLVPVAGLLDVGVAVLGQPLLVGEAGLDLAGAGVLLLAALRLLVADLVDALGLAALDEADALRADVVRAGTLRRILALLVLVALRSVRARFFCSAAFVGFIDTSDRIC